MRSRQLCFLLSVAGLLLSCVQPVAAQTGKLIISGAPREAYLYADGIPIAERKGHTFCLAPGEHKIDLYNYGYKPESRTVMIEAHKTITLDVTMQEIPGQVPGPWGCITVKGPSHAAVLLNGKEPAVFFVGNVGELNSEFGPKELVVPPGKYELTVACCTQDPWTTSVDVPANKRVIVDAFKGVGATVAWPRGEGLQALPRFQASGSMVRVAVEKVSGQFGTGSPQINCGESAKLSWSSAGAMRADINGEPVSATGEQTVQPKATTNYKFTAAGPGGIFTADATVTVNTAVAGSLSVSPAEVRYDNTAGNAQPVPVNLTWSAGNADNVSLDPVGPVGASGSRELRVTPKSTAPGPIDETVTYTLHATNACGGEDTHTATLHITGSNMVQAAVNPATIENKLSFISIYFPTNLPTKVEPEGGLVPGMDQRLDDIVSNFKDYLTVRPEAKLILEAHADVRGSIPYNRALSQRRADRVKSYLVEHGIPADRVETRAFGKEKNLTRKQVQELIAQNPNLTPAERKSINRNIIIFVWANNRRVDNRLSTTGTVSQPTFPYNSDDEKQLLNGKKHVRRGGAKRAAPDAATKPPAKD